MCWCKNACKMCKLGETHMKYPCKLFLKKETANVEIGQNWKHYKPNNAKIGLYIHL